MYWIRYSRRTSAEMRCRVACIFNAITGGKEERSKVCIKSVGAYALESSLVFEIEAESVFMAKRDMADFGFPTERAGPFDR